MIVVKGFARASVNPTCDPMSAVAQAVIESNPITSISGNMIGTYTIVSSHMPTKQSSSANTIIRIGIMMIPRFFSFLARV
ncbi:hypothetical protein SDC9_70976 [bioreactor metagenome]|uniref:Uncharacterized protein n=1 Tax=bioreactor metagenome TaxID=1076179 RepID=A0A644YD84_9ZZZZ